MVSGGTNYAEFSSSLLGLIGIAQLSVYSNSKSFILVLLAPLAFTHPCIHLDQSGRNEIVLSLDLLKFRYMYDENPYYTTDLFTSGSIKLRYAKFYRPNWQWSVFAEWSILYRKDQSAGFQLGFAIRHVSRNEVK